MTTRDPIRRRIAVLALAMGMAGVCGGSGAQAKTTLRLWAGSEPYLLKLIASFEKENKGVSIQLISADTMDKFYTMVTAGLMPDMWGPWSTPGLRADVNRGWATDLTPFIKRDGKAMDIDDFFPGMMREFRVNGKQYSLPVFNYQDYYFYNTQLFAQSGLAAPPIDSSDKSWNWDRMTLYAQKVTRYKSSGAIDVAGVEINTWPLEQNWMHMWKAYPYSTEAVASAVPQKVHFDTPEMVKALTKAWELVNKQHVAKADTLQFQNGKVGATMLCGSTIGFYMTKPKFKWAIAPLPWGETNRGTMWPDGWRISTVCKNKEMAWKFIKYLASPDNLRYTVTDPKGRLGTAASRRSVFRDSMAQEIAKVTGMDPADVYQVHNQADSVGIVKWQETICIDKDLEKYRAPILASLWQNKIGPQQAARDLQKAVDGALPVLYKRWIRNIKFTGRE